MVCGALTQHGTKRPGGCEMKKETKMVYVAVPFWHENETIRNYRRRKAIEYSERLFYSGTLFYSPLLYSVHFKEKKAVENYWITHGLRMVDVCDEMRVLCLEGWENSSGLKGEIDRAEKRGIPVIYITRHSRISFHGSRSLSFEQCMPVILAAFKKHFPVTVVTHGEPEGACEFARKLSKKEGISLKLHHLQHWRMQGQFHWRTVAVLEDSEFAIFLHDGFSAGTSNEFALAKEMGKPYTYYLLENGILIEKDVENQNIKDFSIDLLYDNHERRVGKQVRNSPAYQRFRQTVFERDKKKCVFCGAESLLCVHHIIPFAKSSELSLDSVNGQTLCEACHNEVHGKKQYGTTKRNA